MEVKVDKVKLYKTKHIILMLVDTFLSINR